MRSNNSNGHGGTSLYLKNLQSLVAKKINNKQIKILHQIQLNLI